MDRYEEALANARTEYEKAREQGYTWLMGLLEGMFPDLKESEDEKIRKWLIEEIKATHDYDSPTSKKCVDDALAWLEKQKEQTEELSTRLNGLMQEYVKAGKDEEEQEHRLKCYQLFWDALGDSEFFKQKELPTNEEMLRTLRVEYEKGVADTIAKYDQEEQKPDFIVPKRIRPKFAVGDTVCRPMWSDHTIREIYIDCNDQVYVCVNDEGLESHISFSEQDEWERKEQKPAEWSEEDKEMVRKAIFYTEQYRINYGDTKESEECFNWLLDLHRNIRPPFHWKPSEEQMKHLERCFSHGHTSQLPNQHVLESLYHDLQKLL